MELKDFKLDNLLPDNVFDVKFRIVRFGRGPQRHSYGVYAYPEGAKTKTSRSGRVIENWPEVFIGVIVSESKVVGKSKWWDLYPVTANGSDIYQRPIGKRPGREAAATSLLCFCADRNQKRRVKKGEELGGLDDQVAERAVKNDETPSGMAARFAFEAYMLCYDSFATDTDEVVRMVVDKEGKMRRRDALAIARKIGDALEGSGLIVREKVEDRGGVRASGSGITQSRSTRNRFSADTWQCWETYDSIGRRHAIDLFVSKIPQTAESIKPIIAKAMRDSRLKVGA